jgi:hypothetical protein
VSYDVRHEGDFAITRGSVARIRTADDQWLLFKGHEQVYPVHEPRSGVIDR